jgi:hypothetical protein
VSKVFLLTIAICGGNGRKRIYFTRITRSENSTVEGTKEPPNESHKKSGIWRPTAQRQPIATLLGQLKDNHRNGLSGRGPLLCLLERSHQIRECTITSNID